MKRLILFLTLLSTTVFAQKPLWLRYPAIAPDGNTIAFTYQGDLYTVPASGGQATLLTVHPSHDFMPVWSPDGKNIAFASDRFGNFDIYVIPANGGNAQRLTHHSSHDYPTAFSPDGKNILFNSLRVDLESYADFPNRAMPELYSVPVAGGRNVQVLTTPSELANYDASASKIFYQDRKGYEDPWRKHHKSSIARDIWVYDVKSGTHTQLTQFGGEDRNPIPDGEGFIYYLSEESGNFNVHKISLAQPKDKSQVTSFTKHPVRFLSNSKTGTLCFSYDGEIYTMKKGEQPKRLDVKINTEGKVNAYEIVPVNTGATEMVLSPKGKEVAFVVRGEIFVTSVEGGVTKRITNTPGQERSISFSKDGRSIVYAAERNDNWDVYRSSIVRDEEPYFYASTVLKEDPIVATSAEEFQPTFSPDGKEVAFLEERTTLKVINLATKASRTILPGSKNYSYSDGDQYYQWSPDGQWFLVDFLQDNHWIGEVGLVSASGNGQVTNLTQSGFEDGGGKWMMNGKMMLWFSDRDGMKNHGSWGAQADVYAMFFTQNAFDRFKLSEEDYKLLKEKEDKDKKKDEDKDKEVEPIKIDLKGIEDRKAKLTIHSSLLGDAVISNDGEKMYYLARFEKGVDLWQTNLRTRETKIITKLGDNASQLTMDKDGKKLFVLAEGKPVKIEIEPFKKETIQINGEMLLNKKGELSYVFDHAWRQVLKKFYVTDLHGVDWNFYKKEYAKFLPHISNNWEFSEMLSELLGELNASHTGCRYSPDQKNKDATASLGLMYDENYKADGLRIASILAKGPFDRAESKVRKGHIIEKIDNETIAAGSDYYMYLNRKANQNTLISFYDPATKTRWDEVVKPVSLGEENELLYKRWVAKRAHQVDSLSKGKVGYIHVRGMNDPSYRTVFEEALGKHANKESLIVDTRSNGGGWLHDDLVTFLGGKKYIDVVPRGQHIGFEPQRKWTKASVVLMGESNYSDAHMFPFAFDTKEIGKTIGMPVPGTGTAVWWEAQIDPTLVFGIPQVGMVGPDGKYLENTQLEPDVMIKNKYEMLVKGRDEQLEKAVEMLINNFTQTPDPQKITTIEKGSN
jgi:tricorn protease